MPTEQRPRPQLVLPRTSQWPPRRYWDKFSADRMLVPKRPTKTLFPCPHSSMRHHRHFYAAGHAHCWMHQSNLLSVDSLSPIHPAMFSVLIDPESHPECGVRRLFEDLSIPKCNLFPTAGDCPEIRKSTDPQRCSTTPPSQRKTSNKEGKKAAAVDSTATGTKRTVIRSSEQAPAPKTTQT